MSTMDMVCENAEVMPVAMQPVPRMVDVGRLVTPLKSRSAVTVPVTVEFM